MAKVSAQRASDLTGRSKSTIQRAMKGGKLSYEVDDQGRKLIDVSELERVFGLDSDAGSPNRHNDAAVQYELQRASDMLEMERIKMRLKAAEDQLHAATLQIDDLKEQRDQWQKQAQQILLTNQHTQAQADELKQELKERDRREHEARQKAMEMRMKKMAQNQNQPETTAAATESPVKTWSKLFKKKTA